LHPIKHVPISIRNHNLNAVVVAAGALAITSNDGDAAFAVDEAGRVGPIGVLGLVGHRTA